MAKGKTAGEKPIVAQLYEKNPKTGKPLAVDINDGSIDWGNVKDGRTRLFCYFYTLFGQPSYHNAAESYKKTGSKCKNSRILAKAAYDFRKKHPEIEEFVANFEEKSIKTGLREAKNAILRQKMRQANLNPKKFLATRTVTDVNGNDEERLEWKPLDEISDEDAITYIDSVDVKGGRLSYELVDKAKVRNEILEWTQGGVKAGGDGYSAELAIEQIKDRMKASVKIIKRHEKEAEAAGTYFDAPENPIEEL